MRVHNAKPDDSGDGEKVGTSTGWWNYTGARSDPWLHWVAVVPEYQELGLGSAIISKVTAMMMEIEGDRDFYLNTQIWSHRAIKIYESLGYVITGEKGLNGYTNEGYAQAMVILNEIYESNKYL